MKIAALISLLALIGCATSGKFQANMDSLMHEDVGRVIGWLGPPVNVYNMDDGRKILTFENHGQIVMPGQTYNTPMTTNTTGYVNNHPFNAQSTSYVAQQGPATVIGLSCTVSVTTKNDLVIDWRANGNHCVSR
jgi:hypothetical protein